MKNEVLHLAEIETNRTSVNDWRGLSRCSPDPNRSCRRSCNVKDGNVPRISARMDSNRSTCCRFCDCLFDGREGLGCTSVTAGIVPRVPDMKLAQRNLPVRE